MSKSVHVEFELRKTIENAVNARNFNLFLPVLVIMTEIIILNGDPSCKRSSEDTCCTPIQSGCGE